MITNDEILVMGDAAHARGDQALLHLCAIALGGPAAAGSDEAVRLARELLTIAQRDGVESPTWRAEMLKRFALGHGVTDVSARGSTMSPEQTLRASYLRWWFVDDAPRTDDYCMIACEWIDADGVLATAILEVEDRDSDWRAFPRAGEVMTEPDLQALAAEVAAVYDGGTPPHYGDLVPPRYALVRAFASARRTERRLEQLKSTRDLEPSRLAELASESALVGAA